ncbi:MAG TPA: type II toxin-antitoxin system VapC family toxin [Candidatus Acidoferrales bacterium]|nr:type II toxin-antitoxin system VapC family toxin [Candidatus Acidoferrales bacterium]
MSPRFLADTHVLVRWLINPKRLSKQQKRVMADAERRNEPIALSSVSLLEIAVLAGDGVLDLKGRLEEFFQDVQASSLFRIFPVTFEVATDLAYLKNLRDPFDRAIVSTARVHRLRLITSDQRIVDSGLIPFVE